jgi:hypothetical protein
MKQFLFVTAMLLSTLSTKAQLVRGQATLNGHGTATLNDSVRLYATDLKDGQYQSWIHARVLQSNVNISDSSVLKGTELFWMRDQSLGEVQSDYTVDTLWQTTERRMSKYYDVVLSGTIDAKELHRRSFPTPLVEQFLAQNKGALYEKIEPVLLDAGWEFQSLDEYEVFAYMNKQQNPDRPEFEALLVFRGSVPYCFINRGAPFEYEKIKMTEKKSTGTYYYFQRPNKMFEEQLENVVYEFLPL